MKRNKIFLIFLILIGLTVPFSSAKVSMAVSRRDDYVFVPLTYQETWVEMVRIYNTGDAPLELTFTWTQTSGNLEGVLSPDAILLEANETRLCYLVFNASAMGGLSGVMEIKVVQDEVRLNQSGAGGSVVPAFEVLKSVTISESPVLDVVLSNDSLQILNVGPGPVDDLLTWWITAPEWLILSADNGFGPTTVEFALSPDAAPGTYEGDLIVESNVGSKMVSLGFIVEAPAPSPSPGQSSSPSPSPSPSPTPSPSPNPSPSPSPNPEPKSTRPKGTEIVFVVAILGTVLAGMAMRSRVTDLAPEDDRPTEDRMALRYSLVFTPEEPISELRKLVEDDET